MPTFKFFVRCPICGQPPMPRRVMCRAHEPVLDLRAAVDEGERSDWYPTADRMRVNHADMMRTHPHDLGLTRYGWQAELPAILAWLRVRLWDEPGDPWMDGAEGSAA